MYICVHTHTYTYIYTRTYTYRVSDNVQVQITNCLELTRLVRCSDRPLKQNQLAGAVADKVEVDGLGWLYGRVFTNL